MCNQPLRGLVLKIAARAYRAGEVDGFEVIDVSTQGLSINTIRSRLSSALALVTRHDPRRAGRLRRDLKRFWITDAEGGEFIPSIRACSVRAGYVVDASTDALAALIVHEGVHARLWASGVPYADELRERIERTCVREEIRFVRRLGSADQLVADAEARLERSWWSKAKETERRLRQLEQLGRPAWYRSAYRRLRGHH